MSKQSYLKQFSISTQFSSIWPTPGQNGPRVEGNEWLLCIPQNSSIPGTSPFDCLVSYQDTRVGVLPLLSDHIRI